MLLLKSLKNAVLNYLEDDPLTYAASLAFYTVVSLPAILLIMINLLSTAYERDQIQDSLLSKLNVYLGPTTVEQAETILNNASVGNSGLLPQIIGWAILLFSSTTVFISLQNGINRIWKVTPDPKAGIWKVVFDRIISFAMVVSIGFVLLVSLVIDSMITIFEKWILDTMGDTELTLAWISNILLSFFFTAFIFTLVFKTLPDIKTKWKHVWIGGFFTAMMFLIGKYFIGLYLGTVDVGNPYGASGSLVIFLFWVYYSSALVLFGAKFTYQYTLLESEKVEVSEFSVFVNSEIVKKDTISTTKMRSLDLR